MTDTPEMTLTMPEPQAPDALATLIASDTWRTFCAEAEAAFAAISPNDGRWVHLNAVRTGLSGLNVQPQMVAPETEGE